jgi:predicted enzyme related to lactoylglutathione lyase
MIERDAPTGVPCWIDIAPPDPEAAMDFYGGLFGWTFEDRTPADSPESYHVAQLRGGDAAGIGSLVPDVPPVVGWNTYVRVDNVAATTAKVTAAGGTVIAGAHEATRLAGVAAFTDPAGARLYVWAPMGRLGAQRVNEANTWNWSDLSTNDLDGAKAFYGAVFGWVSSTIDIGSEVGTMWRVPGYADFLESIYPGTRQRHEDGGAPDGFTEAIGWMERLTDETPTGDEPHWRVTFSVDDVRAAVERTTKLGGDVVVPPFDAGGSDVAVVSDPSGAVFTVSKWNG